MSMDMRNQIETRRLVHNALFSRQSFTCYKAIEQPITRGPGAQQQFPIDYHRPRKQGVVTLVSVVALVKLVALSNRGGLVKAVTKFWTPPWIPKMSQKAYKLWSDMRFNLCKILNVQSNFSIFGLVYQTAVVYFVIGGYNDTKVNFPNKISLYYDKRLPSP